MFHFLGVAIVVEFQEAGKDIAAGGFTDGKADALFCLVEPVAEVQVGPTVGGCHSIVHLNVQLAEFLNISCDVIGIVEPIVGRRQAVLTCSHQVASIRTVSLSNGIEGRCGSWQGKSLECVSEGYQAGSPFNREAVFSAHSV